MIGIDIVSVERVKLAAKRTPRFLERVFTVAEREYCEGKDAESLAGIFCAKEAVYKALNLTGITICDIEICREKSGRPYAQLTKSSAAKTGFSGRVEVSITHDGGFAAAVAFVAVK